jgi:hypothetical protein
VITLSNSIKLPRVLDLERLRAEYEAGNQEALALAIHLCGRRNLPLPSWVAEAWERGCYSIIDRRVESWDDVLANGKRKTVKQRTRERIKAQKMWLIRWRADLYRDIPISSNKDKTILVGRRYVPDRFGAIAEVLTSDGKVHNVWEKCARSEAKALWYELFPSDRPSRPTKAKHKKGSK